MESALSKLFGWEIVNQHHLSKTYTFSDFVSALAFVNKIGFVAEEMEHHPDIHLSWGKVRVETYTHDEKGITEKDFVLAAKVDSLSK